MAAAEPEHLEFRGESSTECEAFINAISRQALSIGRQRDDQWVADFASSCITHDALRWWDTLDDETQGSWKLLRKAMLARYCPVFHGGSGEEAEKFVRMVRQRALDEGKSNDNIWITGFASACMAGEALRWHASLEPAVQIDWIKLQQALLARYPRDSQETWSNLVPTPAAAVPILDIGGSASKSSRCGRIRVIKDGVPIKYYIDSSQMRGGYVRLTIFESEAMALEWDGPPNDLQTLSIRGKTHRRETIGVNWDGLGGGDLAVVRRESGTGLAFNSTGMLKGWKISESTSFGSPGFDLTPIDKTGKTLYVQLDLFQKLTLVSTKPAFNSLSSVTVSSLVSIKPWSSGQVVSRPSQPPTPDLQPLPTMSGTPPVSDFKRQVKASTQVPAWGKASKPPPQLAVPQAYGSGGSSPASSSMALPGQKKKKAKADIVYSQPADTGTGRNQGTQMALLLDFLKKLQNPIRLEDLVIQTGVAALETDTVFREKFEAAEGVQKNPINGTYSFKRVYHARTPEELLKEIHLRGRDGGGLSVKHLKEGFPDVNAHITELEKQGRVLVIRTDKDEPKQVFWNEITPEQGGKPVDDEFRSLWDSLKNPVEADLLKALEKEGLQATASEAVPAKPATKKKDKKAKAGNRNVKIQNTHITNIDLRKDFSADKKFGQS